MAKGGHCFELYSLSVKLMCKSPGEIQEEEHQEASKDREPKGNYLPIQPLKEGAVKLKD